MAAPAEIRVIANTFLAPDATKSNEIDFSLLVSFRVIVNGVAGITPSKMAMVFAKTKYYRGI